MDIKDVGSVGPLYPPRGTGDARKRELSSSSPQSDRVEVSDRGQMASQAEALFSKTPDLRESRVEELKTLLDSGRFQVDAQRIARSLLKGELIDRIV